MTCRLLYTWIIPWLDIEGRFYGDAIRIKTQVFPLFNVQPATIERYLQAMEEVGLIARYEVGGQQFLWAPTFSLHQTLRKDRERQSYIPAPPDEIVQKYQMSKYAKHFCFECNKHIDLCECGEEE